MTPQLLNAAVCTHSVHSSIRHEREEDVCKDGMFVLINVEPDVTVKKSSSFAKFLRSVNFWPYLDQVGSAAINRTDL